MKDKSKCECTGPWDCQCEDELKEFNEGFKPVAEERPELEELAKEYAIGQMWAASWPSEKDRKDNETIIMNDFKAGYSSRDKEVAELKDQIENRLDAMDRFDKAEKQWFERYQKDQKEIKELKERHEKDFSDYTQAYQSQQTVVLNLLYDTIKNLEDSLAEQIKINQELIKKV